MEYLHVGIDDTDSHKGGCTTYVAALLVEEFLDLGLRFSDYPNLIRLNPNIPWKTRGNGAVCLRIFGERDILEEAIDITLDVVEENSYPEDPLTHPGVAFYFGKEVPKAIKEFAKAVEREIVPLSKALKLAKEHDVLVKGMKERRGIIGALAAIGETLEGDHTYELIAYRKRENWGKPRKVSEESVKLVDRLMGCVTFNNYDWKNRRTLITPRGPDPVLLGIRGESPEVLRKAFETLKLEEPWERWVIFRTNQGTEAHAIERDLKKLKENVPIRLRARVVIPPRTIPGKHVIFAIGDAYRSVDCAAYEPTGRLRRACSMLIEGDVIEVLGGIKRVEGVGLTVNLEKLKVVHLEPLYKYVNPKCPICGGRMESMGRGQGMRCKKCGFRNPSASKVRVRVERKLRRTIYLPDPKAQRHLTKPYCRYGREKKRPPSRLSEPWFAKS